MNMIYLCILSIFYVLVQAKNSRSIQYKNLFSTNNHTIFFNEGSKINFIEYLKADSSLKKVFDVERVLKDSEIFILCDKAVPNLTNSAELNFVRKYPEILLCMGLYHVLSLNQMMLSQQNYSDPLLLPQTKSDLDNLISNMNANSSLKNEVMCKEHMVTLPTYNSGVEEYVKLLNPLLNNEDTCLKTCLTFDNTINPICALIIEANSVFYNLFKQSHNNLINPAKNVDSVKAAELNSAFDTTKPNTKEIISDDLVKNVPVNKGNVVVLSLFSKDKSSALNNDKISNVTHVITEPVKAVVNNKKKSANTPTPTIPKLDSDAGEILNDENSAENTENAEDYNIESAKQTLISATPVVTDIKTDPTTNNTSKTVFLSQPNSKPEIPSQPKTAPIISSQPNSIPVLLEENNAHEATEVEPLDSKQKETIEKDKNKSKLVDSIEKKRTTKKYNQLSTSSKTSENTVLENKDEFEMSDNEDIPPPLVEQDVVPLPPVLAPNVETVEGDDILNNGNNNENILINSNNNDDESFLSNIDQKQQAMDPGDSVVDIQENTPYIIAKDGFVEAEDSHFFTYFVFMFVICIVMYVGFYNKRKILALALEGRASRRTRSRRGTYSRVNTGYDETKEHLLY